MTVPWETKPWAVYLFLHAIQSTSHHQNTTNGGYTQNKVDRSPG